MKPSKIYKRDFLELSKEENDNKEIYLNSKSSFDLLSRIPYENLPVAVRHNLSLFPNNHIELSGLKKEYDIEEQNKEFKKLIDAPNCLERDILNYINKTPAYHIVGSILKNRFKFGHHELYLFKEMRLGNKYRTDYVLIGKGSGGYEFILIEFEKPDGRITIKDGDFGQVFRNGQNQVRDWQHWMDNGFAEFSSDLALVKGETELPEEFHKYDHTRFHYVVVAGRRGDFNDKMYFNRRELQMNNNIYILHHDNLYDDSVQLESDITF